MDPRGDTPAACMTVDVEEWYHILDAPEAPDGARWGTLESRLQRGLETLLDVFARTGTRATFFWVGWLAERHPALVRRTEEAGHEVASHGYGHRLVYTLSPVAFREDLVKARGVLEDITGRRVAGFRAPGFSVTPSTPWAWELIRETGHHYDSSLFPSARTHGGVPGAPLEPSWLPTPAGPLLEVPVSMLRIGERRLCVFGGGYLRLSPRWLVVLGARQLHDERRPLVAYIHPREVDPAHPRLPLSPRRRFMSYVNLRSTPAKLEWLCRLRRFVPAEAFLQRYAPRFQEAPCESSA